MALTPPIYPETCKAIHYWRSIYQQNKSGESGDYLRRQNLYISICYNTCVVQTPLERLMFLYLSCLLRIAAAEVYSVIPALYPHSAITIGPAGN